MNNIIIDDMTSVIPTSRKRVVNERIRISTNNTHRGLSSSSVRSKRRITAKIIQRKDTSESTSVARTSVSGLRARNRVVARAKVLP
jgi:hypothetical protein